MITDEDAVVRKEFRALSKQLLRGAEPAAVAPHLRMFLAHVCGGMSHVHASVRASALALLDDIVPLFPRAAALLGHKLLPIFLHILGGSENIGSMAGGATAATGAAAWAKMSGPSRGPKLKTMALDERLAILRTRSFGPLRACVSRTRMRLPWRPVVLTPPSAATRLARQGAGLSAIRARLRAGRAARSPATLSGRSRRPWASCRVAALAE